MVRFRSRTFTVAALALCLAAPPALWTAAHAVPSRQGGGGAHVSSSGSSPPGDRYLVVLNDPAADAQAVADDHSRRHNAEVSHVYRRAVKGYAARMSPAGMDEIRKDPRVRLVAPDRELRSSAQTLPTGVNRIDGDLSSAASGDTSGAVTGAAVAIIDTGIDTGHPDLNVAGGVNCLVGAVPAAYGDDHGHGTHVAGIVAAKDDATGVVGVAPGAPLYAVKVLSAAGIGLTSEVICGIDWVTENAAANNIKVANMSLGGEGSDDGNCGMESGDALHEAICGSVKAGVTYVVAAGNDNADLANTTPAAYDEVLTVTAMSDSDGLPGGVGGAPPCARRETDDTAASFSNWTAPGSPDTTHTIAAPGVCIESTWLLGGYNTISGTSMAAPHVAGTATLCIASGTCAGLPSDVISKLRADAAAQPPDYGFTDVDLKCGNNRKRPCATPYHGPLIYAGGY